MSEQYIHGFSQEEQQRLLSQAEFLAKYIYPSINIQNYKSVLEIGMGVGAQTIQLLRQNPNLYIKGIELSEVQIGKALHNLGGLPELAGRYEIFQANAKDLSGLELENIELALLIWVLEHVPQPEEVLTSLRGSLKPGTHIHITEVFNDSLFLFPACPALNHYWKKLNDFQAKIGGDGNIGPKLGNMLKEAGYSEIEVVNCPMHLDDRRPEDRLEMLDYWHALMKSSFPEMHKAGFASIQEW